MQTEISEQIKQAAHSAPLLAKQSGMKRNQALRAIAKALQAKRAEIMSANAKDIEHGEALAGALKDRLVISDKVFDQMIESLHQVADLPDPIGSIRDMVVRDSGINLGKMRVPLGVVGMIYESRPNVTQEASALCLKSGNACVLRGGSEAFHSNQAIVSAIHMGLAEVQLPTALVNMINTTDRSAVSEMLQSEWIDVLIPRGGKALIERVSAEARMPVIKHLDGNCHVYVDESAEMEMAVNIADNAKTQRYGTCNTTESLLVHESIAENFLPRIAEIFAQKAVEMRGCEKTCAIVSTAKPASEEDWYEEYLAPIIAIRVVSSLAEAITHINSYSSHHTDAIVTEHYQHAMSFLREVDSSSVIVNASTRFADGFEYGLGAEIGISTDKFHARGPVGLEGLTSEKWIVFGNGEIRQ